MVLLGPMEKNVEHTQLAYVKIKMEVNLNKLKGFEISNHEESKRIVEIKISEDILNKLIFPFNKFDITALEYKPFTRFTIAKSLDDLTFNELSGLMNSIIKDRNTGCFIISPSNLSRKIDNIFLVKLSTAFAHLIGIPNHDSMTEKYYARFYVKHEDKSDSYLRKAYINGSAYRWHICKRKNRLVADD